MQQLRGATYTHLLERASVFFQPDGLRADVIGSEPPNCVLLQFIS